MDRAEAGAIYDSGREACVEFIVDLAARLEQHEDRLRRLEGQARQDSRTNSRPPSQDPPKTRAQRRAEARAKAKELMRREGERRTAQSGHQGAGRELMPSDQVDEIVEHYPQACGGCGRQFDGGQRRPGGRFGRHQICELPPISVIVTEHRAHQFALPALSCTDQRSVAWVARRVSVWAEVAGGGGDVDRPPSDLPAGDERARRRSVRRDALDRRG